MKRIRIGYLSGFLAVSLFLTACGKSDGQQEEQSIPPQEASVTSAEENSGEPEKTLDEIKDDLNRNEARFIESIGTDYEYTVSSLELIKRNTKEDTDDVYCTVTIESPEGTMIQDYKFVYNYYTTGGWILDEFEAQGDAQVLYSSSNDEEDLVIPPDARAFPLMELAYDNGYSPCAIMIGEYSYDSGSVFCTYQEMLDACKGHENELYVPPILEDGKIVTAAKWDAPKEYWYDDLLTYDAFLAEVDKLMREPAQSSLPEPDSSTPSNYLSSNQTFYYYDGEREMTIELYPEDQTTGRVFLSMRTFNEEGQVLEEDEGNGYYSVSTFNSGKYEIFDPDGNSTEMYFTPNLSSYPNSVFLDLGGVTLELTDLQYIQQNAG